METDRRANASATMSHARAAVREGDVLSSGLSPVGAAETVGSLLARNAARFADHPVFRERRDGRYRGVSWGEFLSAVASFAQFLSAAGVGRDTRVLMFSANRGEMLVAEFASMCLGAIYVPIFAGYPADQARGLIERTRPTVLIVGGGDQLERACVPPSVRAVLTITPVEPAVLERVLRGSAAEHVTFDDALRRCAIAASDAPRLAAFLAAAERIDPHQPCLIAFTSGTSGVLKGVELTHDNILSQQRALSAIWTMSSADRLLSYLPWHHSFGGIFEKYTALYNGATIHIDDSLGKDFDLLLRNWEDVRPTVYFSVPRVYQQLVVHAQSHPENESRIFHPALRFVFTAAAPLPANLSAFFASRRIPVLEGWGLTETSPCCTVTDLTEPRTLPGFVGYPLPGVRLRLAADGEILVQGPNVMRGYFDQPDETAKALPGDGWFHTGDLGAFAGTGLKLVTRKDRVFKMLNAEKVVPTEIENRLAGMNAFIRHAVVAGDGRSFLAALIFPDFFRIAEQFGDDRATAERVVKDSLRETILTFNREHRVKYERIQAFAVISKELTIEDHELTPSLKVRVRDVLANAGEFLEAIYEPNADCDCRFLRRVMRLAADDRQCFAGVDRTLDRCHQCGNFVFADAPAPADAAQGRP
ncbi:MAG: AMP-dependent synthetase/ligase [Gemmatimonadales bacterium]